MNKIQTPMVFEIIANARAAAEKAQREKEKHRVIQEVYADAETVLVEFHTREKVSIEAGEFCQWYNDVCRDNTFFKTMTPDDLDAWAVDYYLIELYCHWQLGMHGVTQGED